MSSNHRLTSNVWKHFRREDNRSKCCYCQKTFATHNGSTWNLKRHLNARHSSVKIERKTRRTHSGKKSGAGAAQHLEDFDERATPGTSTSDSQNITDETLPTALPQTPVQRLMSKFNKKLEQPITINKSHVDDQVLKMICKHFYAFSMVEDEEFRKFVSMLCPPYSLPSKKTLSNSLLASTYTTIFEKVKLELANAKAICLTSDSWTNINNINYYAVTAHYIDTHTTLKSVLLECSEFEEKLSSNISTWIENVLEKFEIQSKISAIVTDNTVGDNCMKVAVSYLDIPHVSCFAHSLNHLVQNAIKSSVQETVDKVKRTVQFFNKNPHALAQLQELQDNFQECPKLKQAVPTRWTSTFDMLERFHLNREPIASALALLAENNNFVDKDWENISECIKLLQVFNSVTLEVSKANTVHLSQASVLSRIMSKQVQNYLEVNDVGDDIAKLGCELLNGLAKLFGGKKSSELIAQSTFLDPRFKKLGFVDNASFNSTYQDFVGEMRAAVALAEQSPQKEVAHSVVVMSTSIESSIWGEFDETASKSQSKHDSTAAVIELDKYLAEPHLLRTEDPLAWWECRRDLYPFLYEMVLKRLCIPATSVPCENIFSKAGQICNERRSCFSSKKIASVLFVNHNQHLLQQSDR